MLLVQHFLEYSAQRTPEKIALICEGRRHSYAEIEAMANRLANALRENGLKRGDRVILYLHNSVELVVGIFAVLKAEGVFVVINATTKKEKLVSLAGDCRPSALVLSSGQRELAEMVFAGAPSLRLVVFSGESDLQDAPHAQPILYFNEVQQKYQASTPGCRSIDQDLACLIYTSGSSGKAKGVMSGHNNVVFAAASIITYLANRPDDIVINCLPLSFDYGLYQLLMVFKFGGTLVLERSFVYPAQALKLIETERVTGLPGVPTLLAILLKIDLTQYDLSSLRYISNTAAALPVSHIKAIRQKFPGVTLYSMYGLTETKRTLYLPPEQLDIRPDSVGIAIPGTEVWIEDDAGNRLGPNQTGELVIRGGHVMRGYWENPEATAKRFRPAAQGCERYCYSGDLFKSDDDGFYYFVGRRDDIIKSRGEKVAPKEVEGVLYSLPDIVEAAVIGVPDPVLGEAIKAFVVLAGDSRLCEKDVLRHCRAHLEDFMVPQHVEIRKDLPKSSGGKILKIDLS